MISLVRPITFQDCEHCFLPAIYPKQHESKCLWIIFTHHGLLLLFLANFTSTKQTQKKKSQPVIRIHIKMRSTTPKKSPFNSLECGMTKNDKWLPFLFPFFRAMRFQLSLQLLTYWWLWCAEPPDVSRDGRGEAGIEPPTPWPADHAETRTCEWIIQAEGNSGATRFPSFVCIAGAARQRGGGEQRT